MAKRPCLECGRASTTTRCPDCTRARSRARGTTTERGYGYRHQRLRADYQRRMDNGETFTCWRCGDPIDPDPTRWQLGHDDHDRTQYRGPECTQCNENTAGRAATAPPAPPP